jgi:hypothetical protein
VSDSKESLICIPMDFVCLNCGEEMTVNVGLSADTSHNDVECLFCHESIVALVPGPIVGGPFPMKSKGRTNHIGGL